MNASVTTKFPFQEKFIALLKNLTPLHSIYVIKKDKTKSKRVTYLPPQNEKSQTQAIYILLVVGHTALDKNLDDLMEEVYNKMNQHCKAYIIYCRLTNLMERISFGDNFLARTLKEAPCMYKEDDALLSYSRFALMHHAFIYDAIETIWKNRIKRAVYLFSIIDVIHNEEDAISKLAVLHEAMVQICLALLYVFWEFKPHHYTLTYLLHLCTAFTTLPETIFPQNTFGLQRQYYMLCNASDIIRFKGTDGTSDFKLKDVDKVLKRCERFLKRANKLGENHLEHLKKVHGKTSV